MRYLRCVFVFVLAACAEPRLIARPATKVECAPPPEEARGLAFDPHGAAALLGSVDYRACWPKDGPPATRIEVTICPDGIVRGATLVEDPFANVKVRTCIEDHFDGKRMAPFDGRPVHVKKALSKD